MKEKRLIDAIRGTEPNKMINVRVPISLHDKVLRQILLEREHGYRAGWTEIVIDALEKYTAKPPRKKRK